MKRMGTHPQVVRTKNFVADAAAFILEQARKAIARSEFRIALSGGNTPAPVYARVAVEAHDLPWESVRFTFGDERCVPPDDPQSNFEWRAKIFLCLLPFLRNQSCVCAAKLIRKSQRRSTKTN
jgi:6-phosphogluconolactonase/Glucosamine-6-phosphate isomerase/deaminase